MSSDIEPLDNADAHIALACHLGGAIARALSGLPVSGLSEVLCDLADPKPVGGFSETRDMLIARSI